MVVLGAGFGGLAVARGLRDAPVDVVVVDRNNFHTFQPLLYQVATAGLDADAVAHAVRGTLRRNRNARFRMAGVEGVDLERRVVHLDRGPDLTYDTLVVALGAVSTSFGIPGVDDHAFPLKTLQDALRIRAHVLERFEAATADRSIVDDGALDVVVCGGGPTGVETAGGLVELYDKVLAEDFRDLPVRRARITLVELADRLLPPFTPESSERARRTLARRGVEVRLGVGVADVTATRVRLTDGTELRAHSVIWAAGVRAHPLAVRIAADAGVAPGPGGRLPVEDDLTLPGRPEVFAIGDVAFAEGGTGGALPQVAQPALQGGAHVASVIRSRFDGTDVAPFRYTDLGSMATIGRHEAVTELPSGRRLSGVVGWIAWLGLHLVQLIGFRNRATVLVNWAWNYLTYDHGNRILASHDPVDPARSAPAESA